jgi:hypothetical protein
MSIMAAQDGNNTPTIVITPCAKWRFLGGEQVLFANNERKNDDRESSIE